MKEQFNITYDGQALADNSMGVSDLAPALLALVSLLRMANEVVGGERKITLNIKAFRAGSFTIDLELTQTLTQYVSSLWGGAGISLIALLFGGGADVISYFEFIRRLKGRKPERTESDGEKVKVFIQKEVIVINNNILHLYQNADARKAASEILKPLEKDGVDSFCAGGNSGKTAIKKEERAYFDMPKQEESLVDEVTKMAFSIITLSFDKTHKWRLSYGESSINAAILDKDFLEKVRKNQVSFSSGDILICEVRQKQSRTADGIKTEYEVIEVLEHKPALKQDNLF